MQQSAAGLLALAMMAVVLVFVMLLLLLVVVVEVVELWLVLRVRFSWLGVFWTDIALIRVWRFSLVHTVRNGPSDVDHSTLTFDDRTQRASNTSARHVKQPGCASANGPSLFSF